MRNMTTPTKPNHRKTTKMKIKIIEKNLATIEAELEKINGKAHSQTITSYNEVQVVASRAEKSLDALPKADRVGAKLTYRPSGPSANSYKYTATSTLIRLERTSSGWFLTEVIKSQVNPKQSEFFEVTITEAQADEIKRRAIAGFRIRPA
jgi:hypothetical protein